MKTRDEIYCSIVKAADKVKFWSFLACPELYCDWFSTLLTFWNQMKCSGYSEFQIPESSFFHLLSALMSRRLFPNWDHLRYNMRSFPVLESFPSQFGDHMRACTIYCNEWSLVALAMSGGNCCTRYISPLIYSYQGVSSILITWQSVILQCYWRGLLFSTIYSQPAEIKLGISSHKYTLQTYFWVGYLRYDLYRGFDLHAHKKRLWKFCMHYYRHIFVDFVLNYENHAQICKVTLHLTLTKANYLFL